LVVECRDASSSEGSLVWTRRLSVEPLGQSLKLEVVEAQKKTVGQLGDAKMREAAGAQMTVVAVEQRKEAAVAAKRRQVVVAVMKVDWCPVVRNSFRMDLSHHHSWMVEALARKSWVGRQDASSRWVTQEWKMMGVLVEEHLSSEGWEGWSWEALGWSWKVLGWSWTEEQLAWSLTVAKQDEMSSVGSVVGSKVVVELGCSQSRYSGFPDRTSRESLGAA
jgi:hypothetical protein